MLFRADFHIHSCLSPCGSLDMSPQTVVGLARARGLNALAISDHNSARNLRGLAEVAARTGMHCLYGIEVTSREEAHLLCLFDRLASAEDMGVWLYERLPSFPVDARMGDQVYVNEVDEIEGFEPRYLGSAVDADFGALQKEVDRRGGLFIPAHIDRPHFGVVTQLGFLPEGGYPAIEAWRPHYEQTLRTYGDRYAVLLNSDAHEPSAIGTVCNEFEAPELTIEALRNVLRARAIRGVRMSPPRMV